MRLKDEDLTKTKSTVRPQARADRTTPAGKPYATELNESQLGQAVGGLIGLLKTEPKP
jgi:hypothetical protein